MTYRARFFLALVTPLVLTVLAAVALTTQSAIESMRAQRQKDAASIAQLLASTAGFAARVPQRVEDVLAEQMVVEARLAAHLVAVAESRAGMSPQEIKPILRDVTEKTALDEFWITDRTGRAYLTNTEVDFTFSPSPQEQPQSHVFFRLIDEVDGVVQQEARPRQLEGKVFKYVGVSGIDKPRIVQVGYEAVILEQLSRDVNLQRMVDDLTGKGNVASIRVVNAGGGDLAASSSPVRGVGRRLEGEDLELLSAAFSTARLASHVGTDLHRVAVPLVGPSGDVQLVALVHLLADDERAAIDASILRGILVVLAATLLGIAVSYLLGRGITSPVAALTSAAAAVERGEKLDASRLTPALRGGAELAQLARLFGRMAAEVQAREEKLRAEVVQLRVEIDEARRAREVAAITESDYFRALQERSRRLKQRSQDRPE